MKRVADLLIHNQHYKYVSVYLAVGKYILPQIVYKLSKSPPRTLFFTSYSNTLNL